MMRIVLATFVTPASENIRGTSALPYHLIKGSLSPSSIPVDASIRSLSPECEGNPQYFTIYTFNNNELSEKKIAEVERELGVTIKVIPLPKWYRWMFKLHLLFLRVFLKYPFVNYIKLPKQLVEEIKAQKPDLIWVMGEELSRIVKQFSDFRRIQIGPDTESLYYYRMMGRRFVMENAIDYWKCALMYRKYARMEREFPSDRSYTYLAVGEEDVRHLQQLNPNVNARFLRHPHYEVNSQFIIHNSQFHQPKIKVLIAGQYNLYMKQEADLLNAQFIIHNAQLKGAYSITFLGKGWEKHVEALKDAGYEVEHIKFAPDYVEEICKHDIQLTPIAIGTGTKGKVLDALANGLLVIGTHYALENIAVKHGMSCIEYQQAEEVTKMLLEIKDNPAKYEEMARMGQEAIHMYHDRKLLAKELFSIN